jgi:hypothetical protein
VGVQVLRATLAGVWIGLIGALSFIETPLKFLAPDVTLPIALGIGRLVLTAANIAGAVLLIALTVASLLQPRIPRRAGYVLGGLWLVLLVEVAVIRPPLNARTDAILAGQDPGASPLHVIYIAADLALLVLLVLYVVLSRPRRDAGKR